ARPSARDAGPAPWVAWLSAAAAPAAVVDPDARRALFVNFREALRRGADAIAWDNVAFVGPWGFRVEDVAAPVLLWYGDDDEMAPPDPGRWLSAHLGSAHLTVYEGQGHLLPLAHWDEM